MISADNLAKKDIFGASDPYVRIDLVSNNNDEVTATTHILWLWTGWFCNFGLFYSFQVIDSVLTKTKKRTLNPRWEEEFLFRVKPADHKLVMEVFDENRLTRDDFLGDNEFYYSGSSLNLFFLGRVELPLSSLPREQDSRTINNKYYILQPRSARSKVINSTFALILIKLSINIYSLIQNHLLIKHWVAYC